MASGSFSHEQIKYFRETFSRYSDPEGGGVNAEKFVPAVNACLERCGLSTAPSEYLNTEFNRLGSSGTLSWQQFFQVMIKLVRPIFKCVGRVCGLNVNLCELGLLNLRVKIYDQTV